ncbi:MAG: acyltransferase family protein [Candidatus Thorarchaeota archaeon]|jgi:hypothetical protein
MILYASRIMSLPTEHVSLDYSQLSEGDDQLPERKHYFQLDVLKAIAIAFVVLDHSLTWNIKHAIGGPFWERTSIPFFLLVMGFNMGISFRNSGATTLRELYSRVYFSKKIKRYVFPFILLYALSILTGFYFSSLEFNQYSLIGWLPFWGPGNWFIPVLLSSILVFPAVYWAFTKSPKVTVLLCFLSEIYLQLIMSIAAPLVLVNGSYVFSSAEAAFLTTIIRTNILFLLPAVAMGLWFSSGFDLKDKRNRFMAAAFPLSFIYLLAYQFFDFRFAIIDGIYKFNLIWGDYTFLVYPYSALIFLLAMKYLPSEPQNRLHGFFSKIGRATYHIFLFQIFYFSIWYFNNPGFGNVGFGSNVLLHLPFYLVNLTVTFIGGLAWYTMEHRRPNIMIRGVWLSGALFSMLGMGAAIEIVSTLTGLKDYWERPLFVLNSRTGPGVMANFITILFFLGLTTFFLWRGLEAGEDEIPI